MLIPFALSPDPSVPLTGWFSVGLLSAIATILALIVICRKTENTALRYGLAAILILPPSLHILAPATDIVLEHRAYIAGLGVALLAMAAIRRLPEDRIMRVPVWSQSQRLR